MKKIWLAERNAVLFTLLWIVLLGATFQNWLLASVLPLTAYIGWIYLRLYRLEKWLARGTKASEVFDDNGFIGQIIRHLYLQKNVISKQKKRTKEILRRLNTNISALPDATVVLNRNFEIEWSNAPASYLLGISRHDIGQRIDNLIRHPDFQCYLISPEESPFLEIESPIDPNIMLQIKLVAYGKNQRLAIIRNVSDQKRLQQSLKHFVANASHELKTPLTSIIGHLEMLEMDDQLSDQAKKSIEVLQQQSDRMQQLIQNLLKLSQIESYQLRADEGEHLSISELMAHVMQSVGKSCDQDGINCTIPDGYYLLGIGADIESICINLIENAIKHTPQNSKIKISWELNSQHELVFSVTDKGAGIAQAEIPRITDRYYRASHTRTDQVTGSGLGLAIVQQAALKHGAKLDVSSRLNKGSTFSVSFPSYRVIKPSVAKLNLTDQLTY